MHSNQILLWLAIYAKKGHTSNDGMFYLTLKKKHKHQGNEYLHSISILIVSLMLRST